MGVVRWYGHSAAKSTGKLEVSRNGMYLVTTINHNFCSRAYSADWCQLAHMNRETPWTVHGLPLSCNTAPKLEGAYQAPVQHINVLKGSI